MNLQRYLKAIYGALVAAVAATAAAYAQGAGHIGYQGGLAIAAAFLTALGVVWAVPNSPAETPIGAKDAAK